MKGIQVQNISIGSKQSIVVIAGPCVIESESHVFKIAADIKSICEEMGFDFIFKASFDKANRTSSRSFRGPGLQEGLRIFENLKSKLNIPILTDIHSIEQIAPAARIVDILQIPAFLCRQTDLYVEAGKFDVAINVKKGQFLAPWDMKNVIEKAQDAGIEKLTLTERGTSFGYNRLIVDMTSLIIMRNLGVPVIFDATHSVQQPGGAGSFTLGNRDFVPGLCRAAVATGCDGLFLEVHDHPEMAKSDASNMITPATLKSILCEVKSICEALK